MTTVLISGTNETTGTLVAALKAAGADSVVVHPDEDVETVVAGLPGGVVDHYVQMPVTITVPDHSTSVHRYRALLEQGLLQRFKLVDEILAHLTDDAIVLLVTGNAPEHDDHETDHEEPEPDDVSARRGLLHVLADAVHYEGKGIRVQVIDRAVGSKKIASTVLSGKQLRSSESMDDYDDWRIQMVGLVGTEF